jgi:hypothetical protein
MRRDSPDWGSFPRLEESELTGDWVAPDECADETLAGGPLRLRFVD